MKPSKLGAQDVAVAAEIRIPQGRNVPDHIVRRSGCGQLHEAVERMHGTSGLRREEVLAVVQHGLKHFLRFLPRLVRVEADKRPSLQSASDLRQPRFHRSISLRIGGWLGVVSRGAPGLPAPERPGFGSGRAGMSWFWVRSHRIQNTRDRERVRKGESRGLDWGPGAASLEQTRMIRFPGNGRDGHRDGIANAHEAPEPIDRASAVPASATMPGKPRLGRLPGFRA